MPRARRCRHGRNCFHHRNGYCRFYHSPSPSPSPPETPNFEFDFSPLQQQTIQTINIRSRSRSRSRSRDRHRAHASHAPVNGFQNSNTNNTNNTNNTSNTNNHQNFTSMQFISKNDIISMLKRKGFEQYEINKVIESTEASVLPNLYLMNDINLLTSQCLKFKVNKIRNERIQKDWKSWNCQEVIDWINRIKHRHFNTPKYEMFKTYLQIMQIDGKQLENLNELSLKLLCLNEEKDRQTIIEYVERLNDYHVKQNKKEPPKQYLDPITFEVMIDPVICVKSGYTYDRKSIQKQIHNYGVDPFTRQHIAKKDLISNRVIKECIEQWKKENI